MNSKSKKALALMLIGGGLATAMPGISTAVAECGATKPAAACSACAGKKDACNPCAAKKVACNPCAAKKDACNPCAAKKAACSPCAAKKN